MGRNLVQGQNAPRWRVNLTNPDNGTSAGPRSYMNVHNLTIDRQLWTLGNPPTQNRFKRHWVGWCCCFCLVLGADPNLQGWFVAEFGSEFPSTSQFNQGLADSPTSLRRGCIASLRGSNGEI